MHEIIDGLLKKAVIIVDGKVMYKAEIIKKINDVGVSLIFTDKGVRYKFDS